MINNAREVQWAYDELGINLDTVGCIMADLEGPNIGLPAEWLHHTKNPERFWIDGEVADSHITLKYGLLPGVTKKHVDAVLDGWGLDDVHVKELLVFDSPYDDENYKCIVMAMESEALNEANKALSMLPNISTFREYVPHMTLAYVKEKYLDEALDYIRPRVQSFSPKFKGINYGKEIE